MFHLVGGFNPFSKNLNQIGSSPPQKQGQHKTCFKPPPSHHSPPSFTTEVGSLNAWSRIPINQPTLPPSLKLPVRPWKWMIGRRWTLLKPDLPSKHLQTKSLHLKMDGWNNTFLLGPGLFSGALAVSFREGTYPCFLGPTIPNKTASHVVIFDSKSHRIHVWYIYLHLVDFYGKWRQLYNKWILWEF